VSPSIRNHCTGFNSPKIAENVPRNGVVPTVPPQHPRASAGDSHQATTLRRQRGWADRQKSLHLMTRDHQALRQYACGVYSLQIPPGKPVFDPSWTSSTTPIKKKD